MSVRGGNTGLGERSETPDVSEPALDFTPGDLKIKLPDEFDGNRSKLDPFLAQCELYMAFNSHKFKTETQQVLWIVTMLRGSAFDWISPFLIDYMKHKNKNGQCTKTMKKDTIQYFQTMSGFGQGIRQVFGDIEEEATAERNLGHLKQRGSAAGYAANFQQLAAKTKWGKAALQHQFYVGLKDTVKDEVARSDKPDDLQELIALAVKIDNRMYERSLEKKGQYSQEHKRKQPYNKYHSPMQVDATVKVKRHVSKEEMQKRRDKKLCFECGLPGHMASSHRKNGTTWKPRKKQLHATGRGVGYDLSKKPTGQVCATQRRVEDCFSAYEVPKNDRVRRRQLLDISEEQSGEETNTQVEEDTSSEEDEEPASPGWREAIPAPTENRIPIPLGWPAGWPRRGEIWEVVQREIFPRGNGIREWMLILQNDNNESDIRWREPGGAFAGTPDWGTRWEVVFQDSRRIGWREVDGTKTYMLRLPSGENEPEAEEPEEGQTWELIIQGRTERLWMNTEDETWLYRESHPMGCAHGFEVGQVYRVRLEDKANGTQRQWLNVLWEHHELAAQGKDERQLVIGTELVNIEKKKIYKVKAMIDSGATGNFISPDVVSMFEIDTRVKTAPYELLVVNGEAINANEGIVDVETKELVMEMPGGHLERITMDVVPIGQHEVILGMPWIKQHNPQIDWEKSTLSLDRCTHKCPRIQRGRSELIPLQDPGEVCATSQGKESGYTSEEERDPLLKQIPKEYHEFVNMFREETGIEALPQHGQWDHDIPLEEGKEPPFSPIYQMSEADLGTLREYIDENLKKGFIRPSSSPAGSPVLFVPKKDGKKRLCVDYRKLNAITTKDRYALPLADELRDRLSGAKVFTKLDLRGAYNLVRMKKGEEWKTAFRCRYGHFEYQVMPFGLTNAPATCMRMMNDILRDYLDKICIAYLDDILVYSKTAQQHIKDVKEVLMALMKAQLLCKPEKCEFHKEKVEFLGYVVTPGGLSMDPTKVNTILDWNQPTNVKEVQSFLGFANFYRRFVMGYSAIAAPLTELTKKDKEFEWTTAAQGAFDRLKQAFTRAPILLTFDPEKPIVVETDASDYALGAVLSQQGESKK
jgi:hypothetical protein